MMKHIFALSGTCNTGKTTTLKALIVRMFASPLHAKLIHTYRYNYDQQALLDYLIQSRADIRKRPKDIMVIAQVKNSVVGIATGGDNEEMIERAYNYFERHHCDIGVFACRSKGETSAYLLNIVTTADIRLYTKKAVTIKPENSEICATEVNICNDADASFLWERIENAILI